MKIGILKALGSNKINELLKIIFCRFEGYFRFNF